MIAACQDKQNIQAFFVRNLLKAGSDPGRMPDFIQYSTQGQLVEEFAGIASGENSDVRILKTEIGQTMRAEMLNAFVRKTKCLLFSVSQNFTLLRGAG